LASLSQKWLDGSPSCEIWIRPKSLWMMKVKTCFLLREEKDLY
jgi:hypothetical protein